MCQYPNLGHYFYLISSLCIQADCITEKVRNHGDWDFPDKFITPNVYWPVDVFKQTPIADKSYCGELLLCFVLDFQPCPQLSNPFRSPDSQKKLETTWEEPPEHTTGHAFPPTRWPLFREVQRQEAGPFQWFRESGVCLLPTELWTKPSIGLKMNKTWSSQT